MKTMFGFGDDSATVAGFVSAAGAKVNTAAPAASAASVRFILTYSSSLLPSQHAPQSFTGAAGDAAPRAGERLHEISDGEVDGRAFAAAVYPHHNAIGNQHARDFFGKQERIDQNDGSGGP